MLLIPVMVLTTVVLWMAAIFAVLEKAKPEPRRLFGLLLGISRHPFCEAGTDPRALHVSTRR